MTSWSCDHLKSHDFLKLLYIHFLKTYKQQACQDGFFQWEVSTYLVTSPHDNLVNRMTNSIFNTSTSTRSKYTRYCRIMLKDEYLCLPCDVTCKSLAHVIVHIISFYNCFISAVKRYISTQIGRMVRKSKEFSSCMWFLNWP